MRIEREARIRLAMRAAWLVILAGVVANELRGHETRIQVAGAVALAVAGAGWLCWPLARRSGHERATAAALAALGCAGAVLSVWAPVAVSFFVVVAIAAAGTFDLPRAIALTALGPVVLAAIVLADDRSVGLALGGAAAALAGLVGGIGRRQAQEQQVRAAQLGVAREVHDVLAHTLAAVAVQLEAADALLEDGGDPAKLRPLVQRSRRLVREGIEETRAAVRALRDEPVELVGRLTDLVADDSIELHVAGRPRPLPPRAGLALYRAAQEALTNARKHAPGAPTSITLEFRDDDTVLRVDNGPASAPPVVDGEGGFGLQGMRERLEIAGGGLEVGETAAGWSVEARVPA